MCCVHCIRRKCITERDRLIIQYAYSRMYVCGLAASRCVSFFRYLMMRSISQNRGVMFERLPRCTVGFLRYLGAAGHNMLYHVFSVEFTLRSICAKARA